MFEPGDRVISTEGLGGILFSKVPKGTQGVVVKRYGFWSNRYTVTFENGEAVEECAESALAKIH